MKKVKVEEICNITTGKLDANQAQLKGKYPFFTCAPEHSHIDTFAFDDKVILIAGNNASGNFHLNKYNGKFNAYQRTYVLTAKDNCNLDFVYYALKIALQKIKEQSQGSQTKFLTMPILTSISIPLYDSLTQTAIARILSSLDNKIELNNKINKELENLARTIYEYWFVQNAGEKWERKKIGEIAETGSGGTPLSSKKEYYENGSIPWINSSELNSGYILGTKNFITENGLNNSSAKLFPENSILIALYGATAGKVSLLTIPATTNQAVCAIMPFSQLYTYYLKFYLTNLYQYFVQVSSGSARDNLSQELVRNLEILLPPTEILEKFNTTVSPLFSHIIKNRQENVELSRLRDFLLPLLMNGQVRVKT